MRTFGSNLDFPFVLKIITLPQVLKKGIDIQLRESFSKSPSRMSQVHVLAV